MGIGSSASSKAFPSSKREEPRIVLTYFKQANTRAELTRWLLSIGQVEFEDKRITREDWPILKPTTPLGLLPILEYGNQTYAQSNSIARFAAKKAGLDGSDLDTQTRADIVVDLYWELIAKCVDAARAEDVDARRQAADALFDKHFPAFFEFCEKQTRVCGGDFVTGDEFTYADVAVADMMYRLGDEDDLLFGRLGRDEDREQLVEKYPILRQVANGVMDCEGLQKYFDDQRRRR